MMTVTASFDVTMLFLVAANVIAILVWVLIYKQRARRLQKRAAAIRTSVVAFFRQNGGEVSVECLGPPAWAGYMVVVDSASSKRFRYSHIVELILRNHVLETCGLELQKVFWRFTIRPVPDLSPPVDFVHETGTLQADVDEYLSEGLSRLRDLPQYEVIESSLETFKELAERETPKVS
jgi:hypothetical protein